MNPNYEPANLGGSFQIVSTAEEILGGGGQTA